MFILFNKQFVLWLHLKNVINMFHVFLSQTEHTVKDKQRERDKECERKREKEKEEKDIRKHKLMTEMKRENGEVKIMQKGN